MFVVNVIHLDYTSLIKDLTLLYIFTQLTILVLITIQYNVQIETFLNNFLKSINDYTFVYVFFCTLGCQLEN